jgi:hypothetical protein
LPLGRVARSCLSTFACLTALAFLAAPAGADFPYGTGPEYKVGPGVTPNDLSGDDNDWKYSATPEPGSPYTANPRELFGVRGGHVVDPNPSVDTAWQTTTGRPDVTLAVLDSGIKWNDAGAMLDLRRKTWLNDGELPVPDGCTQHDCNSDGVFDVTDYAGDPRVDLGDSRRVGPAGVMTPQDLIIAFSNGNDGDTNGFVDDIAGWDFLDNDNDAFDDVQYGHGTGEALGSTSEANNGNNAGSCPNCMSIPMRVGDSFVADGNNFAQAVLYGVDNGALVIQEALGALNNTQLARQAVEYAYDHGVAIIASAADEAAQHHNWPSNYPHTIVVNSVTKYDTFTPAPSYLQFNGCTNFSTKITIAIPSTSCSSDATGVGSGLAGLIYSAALNARDAGDLDDHPTCRLVNGDPCVLSVNEVRQLMASGSVDAVEQVDDINFATQPETACHPLPLAGCTDKNRLFADTTANRPVLSPLATSKSYPARKGFDEHYGFGRVNMVKGIEATDAGTIPPEAEITSPEWYEHVDSTQPTVTVRGDVYARGSAYTCRVEVAPGSEPNNGSTTDIPAGDFKVVSSSWCDGSNHTSEFSGALATLDLNDLKSRFPATAGAFDGPEPSPGPPNFNGRPNTEPYGFVVRVVVTSTQSGLTLTGQDRRNMYLHRDQDMLPGFPKQLPSDGASSPLLVDLDADNRTELVFGTSDGYVHAMRRDGTELPGWPNRSDPAPLHTGGEAFTSGEVDEDASRNAILASAAATDLDHDGLPEVAVADMGGKVYVWNADGSLRFKREAEIDYSGKPLQPFENVRRGHRYRTQHGFIGSPVLADLDGNGGDLELIAANMDRHVYAWHADGTPVDGFPVLVIDRSKISAIDAQTHAPTFNASAGADLNQGAIVDTPAVGDLTGDGKPEIVVGTNEEYAAADDGGINAGLLNTASLALLAQTGQLDMGNSRVFAVDSEGEPGGPTVSGPDPYLPGWPKKVGLIFTELLPVVGEGITGSPVLGPVDCPSGGSGKKVGVIPGAGPGYIFNPDGTSCYGQSPDPQGRPQDNVLATDFAAGTAKYDTPTIPAVGHPAFGNLTPGGSAEFLTPTAGVIRALDLAVNEYQGGQDFVSAFDTTTGQFHPGWPSPVNDLSFLSGPSVADVNGLPGEEVVGGTASLDLYGFTQSGAPLPGFPKLTADWTVANPALGSLGTFDVEASARKVLVGLTRTGTLLAYETDAPSCSPGSWPRFHHDNANSGDYSRDATLPGKPYDIAVDANNNITFKAPGDDLMCGNVDHYEVVRSNGPITPSNFESREPASGAPAPTAPGTTQSMPIPPERRRFVAVRAVDEQGNVGPPAVTEIPNYVRPKGASPMHISLVPAFEACSSPNRTHGAPLAHPSCAPPQQVSPHLTLGAPDVNAKPVQSIGSAHMRVVPGDPGTPSVDEADVNLSVSITDVRKRSDLSDYTGELELSSLVRITDRYNGPSESEPATTQDTRFPVTVPCAATAGSVGATCSVTTTFDAVMPGVIREGDRAIWDLGTIELTDGGADGLASTAPNTRFARQGIFIP